MRFAASLGQPTFFFHSTISGLFNRFFIYAQCAGFSAQSPAECAQYSAF
jgi:hypothetical protein